MRDIMFSLTNPPTPCFARTQTPTLKHDVIMQQLPVEQLLTIGQRVDMKDLPPIKNSLIDNCAQMRHEGITKQHETTQLRLLHNRKGLWKT